jgi:hypothetical protein
MEVGVPLASAVARWYLLSPVSCVLICVMVMRASDRRVRRAALRTLCVWCWG